MPSRSPAQAKLMAACLHGWKPKRKGVKCPPKAVAEEFVRADQRKQRRRSHA